MIKPEAEGFIRFLYCPAHSGNGRWLFSEGLSEPGECLDCGTKGIRYGVDSAKVVGFDSWPRSVVRYGKSSKK